MTDQPERTEAPAWGRMEDRSRQQAGYPETAPSERALHREGAPGWRDHGRDDAAARVQPRVVAVRGLEGDGAPRVLALPDAETLAEEAAQLVVAGLGAAIEERGEAHLALTGGSSATNLYARLAKPPYRDAVPWRQVHLWFGDERRVPVDHPDSNGRLVFSVLLQAMAHGGQSGVGHGGTDVRAELTPGLDLPIDQVHHFLATGLVGGDEVAEEAARVYAQELVALLPADRSGLPRFDLMLLGLGTDGHILSAFPGGPALAPDAPLVMAVPAPERVGPRVPRVTLSPRLVRAARRVLVMVPGGDKADVVAETLGEDYDPDRWPGQYARAANAIWLLTEDAARGFATARA